MIHNLLIPMDGSPCSEAAARLGLRLARQLGAAVCFMHVATGAERARPSEYERTEHRLEEALLTQWADAARGGGVPARTREAREPVAEGIVAAAAEENSDLVVMGTHGRGGLERLLLGSVAERVARLAPIPVLLVRADLPAEGLPAWQRLLVPLDGSPASEATLTWAVELARSCGATLSLLHVQADLTRLLEVSSLGLGAATDYDRLWHDLEDWGQQVLDTAAQRVQAAGVPLGRVARVPQGPVDRIADVIVREAREAGVDALVMGAHGHGGLDLGLLGSVAARVAQRSPLPVLLVKAPAVPAPQARSALHGAGGVR